MFVARTDNYENTREVIIIILSKVNSIVPKMYFVKLHGTQFNYVLACINDMFT